MVKRKNIKTSSYKKKLIKFQSYDGKNSGERGGLQIAPLSNQTTNPPFLALNFNVIPVKGKCILTNKNLRSLCTLIQTNGGIPYTAHGAKIPPPSYFFFCFFSYFMLILG